MRFDSAPWLQPAGVMVFGVGGFGVPGSQIPATGANGPGFAYNDESLPADATKEICGHIISFPTAGILSVTEDTSGVFTAPDGAYVAQYQLYVDGVATGSPVPIEFLIGVAPSVPSQGGFFDERDAASAADINASEARIEALHGEDEDLIAMVGLFIASGVMLQ